MNRRIATAFGLVLASLAIGTVKADTTLDFSTNQDYLNPSPNGGWTVDRFAPASFEATGGVLQQGIAPPAQSSSFYNYQGMAHALSASGDTQKYSIDLFVDSSWSLVNAGFWLVGYDSSNAISSYPIIAYRNNGVDAAGFYDYQYDSTAADPINGSWEFLTAGNVGQWNHLDIQLNVGTGVDYLVNGVKVGDSMDTSTTHVESAILNAYNYNNTYTVKWDNLSSAAVPLPASALAGLTLLGLLAGKRVAARLA